MKAAQSIFLLCAAIGSVVSRCTGSDYRFVGRVNPETNELTWPSTGVAFTFTGTTASININSVSGASSVALFIDDNEPIIIPNVEDTSISTPTLSQGTHTVELRKRSEAYFGTFRVVNVTTDGTLVPSTAPERKIEIIGDSISVGYGLDGEYPCSNSAILENNPETYGAVAADAVGADYSVVAWSGKGLVRNYASTPPDTSPTMPVIYTRYGANDADGSFTFPPSWIPDAVVINLGTNDFSYLGVRDPVDPADLTAALVELMEKVNSHYPAAKFFLVSSPLLNDDYPSGDAQKTTQLRVYQDAAEQLTDMTVRVVDWPAQGSDVGCDYHPNAATQAKGAALLEEALRDEMGW
ncbi:SGNH hydrolase-type esterase domain-containing protein [Emericellopsis atlantica]|uniref:SGNH hydrolase-type esterase domain-containing protein n=1 Tax=Emericellopsis atlantica TaxID=2614577 RepID=A0A9P7ZFS1_9HYPO|nr:SGNH hydrolase-type esterase domain-containing protein [Emericellopsis atlantica]KAG9251002.1 SGNH hydrolase-type esterase domain-containing protein [Emericellopsis atlantica]